MEICKWNYNPSESKKLEELYRQTGLDKDLLMILLNRSIDTKEKIDLFLSPSLDKISNPFSLSDMDIAIKRIVTAIDNKEEIWVYGDYDVDGITSTSLFVMAMKRLGKDVNYYIPLRGEGYGINKNAISKIASQGGKLLITVDCGISSNEEIAFANTLGIDTIITDHHEITGFLPDAYAIINPKRPDNSYKFKDLAGVGTIFMVLYALFTNYKRGSEIFDFLDIVAIGTVADIVPLVEENRIFVKHGLAMFNHTKNQGLKKLLELIFEDYKTHKFTSYDIGFKIAPVFNAAGRLEDAKKAVELLITHSIEEISKTASFLKEMNVERQSIEKEIILKVEHAIEINSLHKSSVIIAADSSFHHGVIGIAASKITDKYYKPTFIIENRADGTSVGSARSIEHFNIISALNSMKELFVKYGGHESAAGFTLKTEDLPIFIKRMTEFAENVLKSEDYIRPVKIEKEIPIYKASLEFYNEISKLAPFGFGNSNPLFSVSDAEITNIKLIGKGQEHLMFDIKKGDITIKNCAWFNRADYFGELHEDTTFDIAFKLDLNLFNDRYSAKIYIEDIQISKCHTGNMMKFYSDLSSISFPIQTIFYSKVNNIEVSGEFFIDFENSYSALTVKQGQKSIGTLSNELSFILKSLYEFYNYKFEIKVKEIKRTDSNYHIYAQINRALDFKTFAFNTPSIFKDIKEFLIEGFDYNLMQKNVLKSLFHDKNNTLLISKHGRGIKTIILTLAVYFYHKNGHKSLLTTDEEIADPIVKKYFEIISPSKIGNIAKYPFAAFYDADISKQNPNLNFVFSETDIDIPGFEKIIDSFEVPSNITLMSEKELMTKYNEDGNFFFSSMPVELKKSFIGKVQNKDKIYATRDILSLLN